jgi:hypothetical protein
MEQTRREFLAAGTVALTSLPGDVQLQLESGDGADNPDYRALPLLLGPKDARPEPGGPFFDDKVEPYAYIYESTFGDRAFISDQYDSWQPLVDPSDRASASLDLDSEGVVTGSGDGPEIVTLPTSLSVPELFDSPSDGVLRYTGEEPLTLLIIGTISVSGANTTFEVAFAINGLPAEGRTETTDATSGSNKPAAVTIHGKLMLQPGDEITVKLENTGGTTDLTVEQLSVSI